MTRQRAAAVVRVLAGLTLLAGVPAALVVTVGWPLPREVPSLEQLREAFDRHGVPLEVLMNTLAVVMWVAWAQLVVAVVAETVAAARGRQASRAAVVPGVQLVARHFVASGALVLSLVGPWRPVSAAGGVSHLDTLHQQLAPIEVPTAPGLVAAPRPTPPPAPPRATSPPGTYVVQRGDSYWGLAHHHLGDGARWREIRDVNVGRTVAAGHVIGARDDDLQPGWVIQMPAIATPSPPAAVSGPPVPAPTGPQRAEVGVSDDGAQPPAPDPGATGVAVGEVTVVPGDDFWKIAERTLTDRWGRSPSDHQIAHYWRQLVEINRHRLAPPGDPDLIYPGQRLLTPPIADPTAPTAPAPGPTSPPPPPQPSGPVTVPAPAPSAPSKAPQPDGSGPAAADGTPPGNDSQPSAVPEPIPPTGSTDSQPPTAAQGDEGLLGNMLAPVGLAGGGLSLAGLVLWLDRRRRAQQRHRRRGRRIRFPPKTTLRREAELRAGADIDRARLVDVALRAAAAGCGPAGLPPLRWVEATDQSVLLVLAAPTHPPPGFTRESPDRWRTDVSLEDLTRLAGDTGSPAPTLVPVGVSDDGAELLVEFEARGVVTVSGPSEPTVDFVRALAVAAATVPWCEQSRVIVVGLEDELCSLPQLSSCPSLSDAIHAAEARAERATDALQSIHCETTAQARATGTMPDAWDPLVVVSARVPSGTEARRLGVLAARPHHGVAVVTPAGPTHVGPAFVLDDAGRLRIDGIDTPLQARLLDDTDAGIALDVIETAASHEDTTPEETDVPTRPAPTPTGPPTPEPPAGRSPLDALLADVEVMVRVLGEVEAVRVGPAGQERVSPERQKSLEALTYLALRESPVDREDLEITLFPTGANATKTFHNTVSAARRAIGDTLFPPPTGGRYELSERVVTDYALFCELVARANDTEDTDHAAVLLHDALSLVRGEPFIGVGRNYTWVSSHRGMIVAQVVDAAEALAEMHLASGDWRSAEWAARQALRAFPCDERMYRILMRSAAAAGNIPGVERSFRELCAAIADPDDGVEPADTVHPETVALLEQLTSRTRHHQVGA
jgi:nucleoid-associated protein YgaU/DNA-binding SARP family transcriptional activator